jgi:hypothetical protein
MDEWTDYRRIHWSISKSKTICSSSKEIKSIIVDLKKTASELSSKALKTG